MIKKPEIVFFGSGPVAAKSLELLMAHFSIEAVITKPKPPHHKGNFPVLDIAEQHDLPIVTVTNKAALDEAITKATFSSPVGILIDFGIIVSQKVIDYFPYGIVNSHFSLLPEWRGADPITFAILSGQKQTGISLMLLVAAMDEGPLLAQATYDLNDTITTPQLTDELIDLSNQTIRKIVPLYLAGKITPSQQTQATIAPNKIPTYSRKLSKQDGVLDWQKPAKQLAREIRAFIGWPGSRTTLFDKDVIVTKAYAVPSTGAEDKPGDVTIVKKVGLIAVATINGSLWIERLKPSGKREMSTKEFLAGYQK